MRIAIFGVGGVGGYFGWRLAQSGEDVVFIARGENLRALKNKGLTVDTPAQNSEFACPFAGPALDHDLRLGEEFHGVPSLSVQVAEEALAPSAERKERHGGRHTDVDADVA